MEDFKNHPCFDGAGRHSAARIHLPVAAKCNVQCNFCNRKNDCLNESRPGVTSALLSPPDALRYLEAVCEKIEAKTPVTVVGVAGPGDPFTTPDGTLATLRLVREKYPDKILCAATNGLNLAPYAKALADLRVSHVTVTVNAVKPETGAKIYAWVRREPKVYRGVDGAKVLLEGQAEGIRALSDLGIIVKINTVIIPGINETEAGEAAKWAAALGAKIQNCIPLMHVEATPFEIIPVPTTELMVKVREEAAAFLPQMSHCARCRADAAGLIGEEPDPALNAEIQRLLCESAIPKPSGSRPHLAIASMEGLFVNRHLGEATGLWVFGIDGGAGGVPVLIEQRPTPPPGGGDQRWESLARQFSDCFALLTVQCGANPKKILEANGLRVLHCEGLIKDLAAPLLAGKGLPKIYTPHCSKGSGCGGTGTGCM